MAGLTDRMARDLAEQNKIAAYPKYEPMVEFDAKRLIQRLHDLVASKNWEGDEIKGMKTTKIRNDARRERLTYEFESINKAIGRQVFADTNVGSIRSGESLYKELHDRLLPDAVIAPIRGPPKPLDPKAMAEHLADLDMKQGEALAEAIFLKNPGLKERLIAMNIPLNPRTIDPSTGKFYKDWISYLKKGEGEGRPKRHRKHRPIVHFVSPASLGRGCGC